jgi:surface polysaccharide O-acyltransferase-like enzyme
MYTSLILLTAEATEAAEEAINLNDEIANFGLAQYLFSGFGLLILAAIFIIPLFIATIPANIAKKKGRNFGGYYLFGYFLFIPALIVALVVKPIPQEEIKKKSMADKAMGR